MVRHPWFEIEEPGEHDDPEDSWDFSDTERAFVEALRKRTASWPPTQGVSSFVSRPEDESALLVALSIFDMGIGISLLSIGAHFTGGVVAGDRLHNQLNHLPETPSSWALRSTGGEVDELAHLTADWFQTVLRKPVVLYVWLHEKCAYAARYVFADTDETLCQMWSQRLAPPGKAEELIAAGHAHGKDWIQTRGLHAPNLFVYRRGDRELAVLPPDVRESTQLGPLDGVWYE